MGGCSSSLTCPKADPKTVILRNEPGYQSSQPMPICIFPCNEYWTIEINRQWPSIIIKIGIASALFAYHYLSLDIPFVCLVNIFGTCDFYRCVEQISTALIWWFDNGFVFRRIAMATIELSIYRWNGIFQPWLIIRQITTFFADFTFRYFASSNRQKIVLFTKKSNWLRFLMLTDNLMVLR